jgi:HPt (histidine-containing phosphotransfer) domain-containing protein
MDLSFLKKLMGGDEKLVNNFVTIFRNQTPQQLAEIKILLTNEAWEELSNTAHSLKTQFSYMGLDDFADQMKHIETLIDNGELTNIHRLLTDFEISFTAFWSKEFSDPVAS